MIKSRWTHKAWFHNRDAAWPDSPVTAAVLSWSLAPWYHWTNGWLCPWCSFLLQGGGGRKRKGKKRKNPETWMKHLYSWEAFTSGNRKPVRKPGWLTALGTLSLPDRLVQTALDQPVGFKESHSAVPCKCHLPFFPSPCQTSPSCGIWGQEFHRLKIT